MNLKQAFISSAVTLATVLGASASQATEGPSIDEAANAVTSYVDLRGTDLERTVYCSDGTVVYSRGSAGVAVVPPLRTEQSDNNLRNECKAAGLTPGF